MACVEHKTGNVNDGVKGSSEVETLKDDRW